MRPRTLALLLILSLPLAARGEDLVARLRGGSPAATTPTIRDGGAPERAPGDGERIVVEVGAPDPSSQEHLFVTHVAKALDATEVWDGAYDLDALVADLADPARRSGARKKIGTLVFAGHMLYVAPHGNDIVKDQDGVPFGYLVAGHATYAADLHAHFVALLEAALRKNGLGFSDVFEPDAVIEFKVCNGAIHAKDLMEGLARDLPAGAKVKAYDAGYVWQHGAYSFLGRHDLEYRWGLLGQWFGERPAVEFNLGDEKDALVVFPGENDGLATPPPCPARAATAPAPAALPATLRTARLAGPTTSASACPGPSRTPGIVRALRAE